MGREVVLKRSVSTYVVRQRDWNEQCLSVVCAFRAKLVRRTDEEAEGAGEKEPTTSGLAGRSQSPA